MINQCCGNCKNYKKEYREMPNIGVYACEVQKEEMEPWDGIDCDEWNSN